MKRIVILVVIALLVGAGIVMATSRSDEKKPADTDMSGMDMPANTSQSANPKPNPSSEAAETNKVDIKDFAYVPATITVKKGTTVTWTNQDEVRHDVTPVKSSDFEQSELLGKGESYSVTFNTVGSFAYFCSPHPYMKGQVIVTE